MKFIAPARVALVAVIGAVALVGCSTVNPIITQKDYAPSDGLQVQIGDVRALNLLIITTGEGEPASLTGSLHNAGESAEDIIFALDGQHGVSVSVPAGALVKLSLDGDASVVAPAPAAPGRIATISIQSDDTGVITTPVPVLDGTLPAYRPELAALESVQIPPAES